MKLKQSHKNNNGVRNFISDDKKLKTNGSLNIYNKSKRTKLYGTMKNKMYGET
jgi:hypothetical protein